MPTASIGLPVFNGERYLNQAIESIHMQTFEDWELIIGDNSSTDGTEQISREWAGRDHRIRYWRHEENRGAAFNYNFVLSQARGAYLKWQAHDDVCGPRFLSSCIEVLDSDASAVLAYPSPLDIDEAGAVIGPRDAGLDFGAPSACERFRAVTGKAHACLAVFGVFRRQVFDADVRHGDYPSADRVLLAEIALYGRLVEVPEKEYFHREHAQRYSQALKDKSANEQAAWFDPDRARRRQYPHWRRLQGYASAISRAPVPLGDRVCCWYRLSRWSLAMTRQLVREVAPR